MVIIQEEANKVQTEMSTAKNATLCIRSVLRWSSRSYKILFDYRAYITITFYHYRFAITTRQVRRDSQLVASEKLDVSPSTATNPRASGRRMALLCAADNTCTGYKVMASHWTARSSMGERTVRGETRREAPAGESVISSSPPTPRRALPL